MMQYDVVYIVTSITAVLLYFYLLSVYSAVSSDGRPQEELTHTLIKTYISL